MSDTPPPAAPVPLPDHPALDPVTVLFALGSDIRWPAMKLLAQGKPLRAFELAQVLRRNTDTVNRQLKVLCEAGLIQMTDGQDRRYTYFTIVPALMNPPGQLNLGFATIRLTPP
jgi:hypothetical protein